VSAHQLSALADQLRSIPLEEVLRLSRARPDRYDSAKWHTARGVLSVNGAQFMNWSGAQGGGGAIDLVMHLHQVGFGPAVQWLGQRFGGGLPSPPDPLAPKGSLRLPPPAPAKLWRVRRYLLRERGLPLALIEPLIQAGLLYAERARQCRLFAAWKRKPARRRRTAGHHRSALAWAGARLSKRSGLLLHARSRPAVRHHPGRIRHRRHQLLCAPPPPSLHLHGRRPAQPLLAGGLPRPRRSPLLRL
jgi:hypothetical protein